MKTEAGFDCTAEETL